MTALPPPSGSPVGISGTDLPIDPWLEQARRRAVHDRARRRHRLKRLATLLLVVAVIGAAIGSYLVLTASDSDTAPSTSVPVVPTPTLAAPATIEADELVQIGEVWLVDRGDEVYDWGVTVLAAPLAPTRSGVEVEVRLVAADGEVVETVVRSIDGVDVDSPGAAIGQAISPNAAPVRIEFDVSVGVESNDAAYDEFLAVRSLSRSADELTGLVRSTNTDAVSNVAAVFVWRDEDREVVAMAVQPIDEVRPGVDARFELDLAEINVPDGRPDDVFWIPQN